MIEMMLTELAVTIRCVVHCHALEDLFMMLCIFATFSPEHACRTPLVVPMCPTHGPKTLICYHDGCAMSDCVNVGACIDG